MLTSTDATPPSFYQGKGNGEAFDTTTPDTLAELHGIEDPTNNGEHAEGSNDNLHHTSTEIKLLTLASSDENSASPVYAPAMEIVTRTPEQMLAELSALSPSDSPWKRYSKAENDSLLEFLREDIRLSRLSSENAVPPQTADNAAKVLPPSNRIPPPAAASRPQPTIALHFEHERRVPDWQDALAWRTRRAVEQAADTATVTTTTETITAADTSTSPGTPPWSPIEPTSPDTTTNNFPTTTRTHGLVHFAGHIPPLSPSEAIAAHAAHAAAKEEKRRRKIVVENLAADADAEELTRGFGEYGAEM